MKLTDRILELAVKKLAREATVEELRELNELLNKDPDASAVLRLLFAKWATSRQISKKDIDRNFEKKLKKRIRSYEPVRSAIINPVKSISTAMFKSYWKIAWRNIARHKTFTVINVLGLALGICFCLIIFLVAGYEFSFDRFHPDGERIFHLGTPQKFGDFPAWNSSRLMSALPDAIRKEIPGVEAVAGFNDYWQPKVKRPDKTARSGYVEFSERERSSWAETLLVDTGYFSIFRYDWLAGSPATLQYPFQVVLSASRARKYFGNTPFSSVIGQELIFDDSIHLTVSGVVADWTKRTDFATQEFVSYATIRSTGLKNRILLDEWVSKRDPNTWVFVKLAPGVNADRVSALLTDLVKKHGPQGGAFPFTKMLLQPLSDIHFNSDYSRDDIRKVQRSTLYGIIAIAVFILALAGINFVNLSTAQSVRRAREVGVRKVLGSGRMGLTLQFLTETLLVVLFSVILAVSLVKPVLGIFRDFIPPGVDFRLNGSVGLFLLVMTLLTTVLAGYYPARILSSYRPVTSLKGAVEYQGNQGWTLRRGLIVFQFSISLAFIICTLVVGNQVRFMLRTDYGLKTDAVVTVAIIPEDSARLIKVFQDRLSQLACVEKVTRENGAPIGWGHMVLPFVYRGAGRDSVPLSEADAGDESFVPFYQMRVVAGRNIRHTDSLQEVLVNETATRSFGFKRPEQALGKFLYYPVNGKERAFPIVGVVADYHTESFQVPIHSLVIGHLPESERYLGVRLAMAGKRAGDLQRSVDEIEKVYKSVFPTRDFYHVVMDESIRDMYQDEMSLSMLVRSAMLVTIFISCMGLFGVSLFAAEKRTREIGIRKVLGASVSNIVMLLNREFLALITLSILIASPIAWWTMSRWLDGYAYRIRLGLPLFAAASLCGILIALATVSFQSIRAARANPVKSLKTE